MVQLVDVLEFGCRHLCLNSRLLLNNRLIYLLHGLLLGWLVGLLLLAVLTFLLLLLLLSLSDRIQILLHGHLRNDLLLRLRCASLDGLVSNQKDTGAGGWAAADERLA